MAIYHFSGQTISRSAGRSSVAAGAYRAAECLVDARTGFTHNFIAKEKDVFFNELLLPKVTPNDYQNRATLCNEDESFEKR